MIENLILLAIFIAFTTHTIVMLSQVQVIETNKLRIYLIYFAVAALWGLCSWGLLLEAKSF